MLEHSGDESQDSQPHGELIAFVGSQSVLQPTLTPQWTSFVNPSFPELVETMYRCLPPNSEKTNTK